MNIDSLEPGYKLDNLVAEKVMGWTPEPIITNDKDGGHSYTFAEYLCGGEPEPHQGYEMNLHAAICLVDDVLTNLTPLEICKAALKAMELDNDLS